MRGLARSAIGLIVPAAAGCHDEPTTPTPGPQVAERAALTVLARFPCSLPVCHRHPEAPFTRPSLLPNSGTTQS